MLPKSHPLIEAATKPLNGNAEQHLAARALLEETFDTSHPHIQNTLQRYQETDSKNKNIWKYFLYFGAFAVLFTVAFLGTAKFQSFASYSLPIAPFPFFKSAYLKQIEELSPSEQLLLGDPFESGIQQSAKLWQSDPTRPDFFAEYAIRYFSEYEKLPENYFKIVSEIAPKNSFFLYFAAAIVGRDSIEKIPQTKKEKEQGKNREFTLLDEQSFAEAISLFYEASELPEFDTYHLPLSKSRIFLLPQRNVAERLATILYMMGTQANTIRLRSLADTVSAAFYFHSLDGDQEKFHRLNEANNHFLNVWGDSPPASLVDELVFWVSSAMTTKAAHNAATILGIEDNELNRRRIAFDKRKKWRKTKKSKSYQRSDHQMTSENGSLFQQLTIPMVAKQVRETVPLSEQDLKPARLVDHEVTSQFSLIIASISLSIATFFAWLFRFRTPSHIRRISVRMSQLLSVKDWSWILLVGVISPILYVLIINRLTPLGGRGFSLSKNHFVFPFLHFLIALLIILSATPILSSWRLRKKLAPFSLSSPKYKLTSLLIVSCTLLTLIAFPLLQLLKSPETAILSVYFLPALLALTVVISALSSFLGKPKYSIMRAATAKTLPPAFALGIVTLSAIYPILSNSERHWVAEDTTLTFDARHPEAVPYEYRVSTQLRKEIKSALYPES